eukprot:GFYU01001275.1.p1 GENE.GFYU01001275.1~~GFYU01001275.1.p1  ORF type:complete len:192 (+),score=61.47 GFYU01001275.1:90-665(+)
MALKQLHICLIVYTFSFLGFLLMVGGIATLPRTDEEDTTIGKNFYFSQFGVQVFSLVWSLLPGVFVTLASYKKSKDFLDIANILAAVCLACLVVAGHDLHNTTRLCRMSKVTEDADTCKQGNNAFIAGDFFASLALYTYIVLAVLIRRGIEKDEQIPRNQTYGQYNTPGNRSSTTPRTVDTGGVELESNQF